MQGTNIDPNFAVSLGSPDGNGNRMDRYFDVGAEWGGPLVKDRLWLWGSLARTDVRVLALTQALDRTVLENGALKASSQARQNLQASFLWFRGNKLKWGRDASPARPPETTLNQTGPSDVIKGEVNWNPRPHWFLTFRGAYVPTGFDSVPQGGMSADVYTDDSGVWHGSYWDYRSDRPQQVLMGEGTCFLGAHEVSFGVSWRRTTATTSTTLSSSRGNYVWSSHAGYPDMIAFAVSPWTTAARAYYTAGWIGDTFTVARATINAGVRFDSQRDGVLATSAPAVPGFEKWLPAISSSAVPGAITWNAVSPRLGVTYAIGQDGKTQARASYGIFASQLGNGTSSVISQVQYRYAAFDAVDRNGNKLADPSEIDTSVLVGWSGFNPANPGKVQTPLSRIGTYTVPRTHEVIVGLDRELRAGIGLSASFTWRRMGGFNWSPNIGVTSAMYTKTGTLTGGPLPDGTNFTVPYYALLPASVPAEAASGGVEYKAREGYTQRFWGLEVSATRRLSGRWMGRVGFSTNDHREYIDRTTALTDPTSTLESPNIAGGVVMVAATGSGKTGIYQVLPAYQFLASGLYQGPWHLDISANMVLRQGFAQPWYRSQVATGDALNNFKNVLLATDLDRNRLPTVTSLDGRLARSFSVGKGVRVSLQADVFNLINASTPLRRQNDYRFTGPNGFDQIQEIMNPLVVRLGASVAF
ncbi:MAG: hypothetical protein NTY02_13580 [Acidobacteria bacterium]|nr:hypothetical protein [Acidobacteriota bacterium]